MSDTVLPIDSVSEVARMERLLGDERLARLAGRGGERAFTALYERHHQALYRYCRSIVRNDHDAQDALQSAMMRAWAALRKEERDLAVRPWLFRIVHNEAVSILRRRGPERELGEDHERLDGGVEHAAEARERLSTLVADLQALPERRRAALVMRELSGLSIAEIAGALSISQGAAKQTLFEARGALHEISEGRAMRCEAVREAISERDGRVLRGRRIAAHLRACGECRAFREAIGARGAELRALAPPLPAAAAGAMLARLLADGGAGHAGGAAAAGSGASLGGHAAGSGASLGGHAAGSLLAKGLVGLAVAAAAAGTVHLVVERHRPRGESARGHSPAAAGAAAGRSSTAGRSRAAEAGGRAASPRRPRSPGPPAAGSRRGAAANTAGGGRSAGGAGALPSAAGGPRAQRPASRRPHGEGPGNRPGNRPAGGRRTHRPAVPHRSAPHRPASPHGKATHGTPAPKRGAPAGGAPRHGAAGGAGGVGTGSEAAGGPPRGRSSAARRATLLPARWSRAR
jgi:RNA polymerase sigma factor (sigma-70 family)